MTYDWNRPLLPGSVVCANYNNFNGDRVVGIFVVLYDEQSDSNVLDSKNVMALKLSTKGTCVSNYSVEVNNNMNNFLNDDCIACCSKIHTLHKQQQIYKLIGILHPATYHKIYKLYIKYMTEVQSQLLSNL